MEDLMSTSTIASPHTQAPAGPAVYRIDPAHSEVRFRVRHLLSRVGGHFRTFTGTIVFDAARPEGSRVEFAISAASVDTGVADRDAHLRSDDFFAVEQYPEITFVSDRVRPAGADTLVVSGTLAMRGISRPIELPVTYLGSAKDPWGHEKAAFEASTRLNRKDFGLTWNAALETGGLLVGDDVDVQLHVQATRS
jgi:polyisoprenoid-binding protein YceI